jgi:hypothetical protein
MSPAPPQSTDSAAWPARAETIAKAAHQWLTRPRVTLCVVGILLAFGGLLMTNSVWTLPLVIVGAVMVAVAWIGHRLEGRFAVEWGQTGTELAFRATVKPARPTLAVAGGGLSNAQQLTRAPDGERDEIVEGEAHTVEVDVTELKALINAVETADGDAANGAGPDIRIHRVANGASRTSEPQR